MRSRLASTLIVFLALSLLPAGASGGDGNSAVSTPPGQALPLNTAPPLITGTASQDQTLSADPGTWSGPNPTYAAQWLGCDTSGSACTPIASAASLTYRPTSADVGRRLRVAVVVTNKNGSAVATSDATAIVTSASNSITPSTSTTPTSSPTSASSITSATTTTTSSTTSTSTSTSPTTTTLSTTTLTTTTVPPPTTTTVAAPTGDQHAYPRTFIINRTADVSTLWQYDWVVAFPWMNVQGYHAQNPTGIAMTYVREDLPAAVGNYPEGTGWTWAWHESSINLTYQEVSNALSPGVQEQYTIESWPGGTDNLTDGQAANVGYMRAWDKTVDSLHNSDGSFALGTGCQTYTVCHLWDLRRPATADLLGRLMVYNAKRGQVYGKGWDGIWSDNAICANSSTPFCDGLQQTMTFLRSSLPGKIVGGNGACEVRDETGWYGSDPQGFYKMANASLVEGLGYYGGNADRFIAWNNQCLAYPDPYGMPRYNAFWDFNGGCSYARERWALTLAMMASAYFQAACGGWYDEFWGGTLNQRGYLGHATGAAVKLANGVWRRDFTNGIALNNSTGSTQTISLGGTFRKLTGSQDPTVNNGSAVTSVTIPAQDGLILLR